MRQSRHQPSYRAGAAVLVATVLFTASCGSDDANPTEPGPVLDYSGTWNPATNFGGPFGHDRQPVRSDHFVVYGASATQAARQETARVGEEALAEILDFLPITTADFEFLPSYGESRIHVMAIGTETFGNNTGFAYRDGLVVISTEAPQYARFGFEPTRYKRLLKHETTHVVEFLLIGDPRYPQASDVWWREGFAHYTSRPRPSMITTRAQVEAWIRDHASLPGEGNPIAVHVWSDFPASIRNGGQTFSYYDMFELTVRYLLDSAGYGGTPDQVVALYDELGTGASFASALNQVFGLDLTAFEEGYWDTILEYLDGSAAPAGG